MAEPDDEVGFMLLHVKTFLAAALNLRENVLKERARATFELFYRKCAFFSS